MTVWKKIAVASLLAASCMTYAQEVDQSSLAYQIDNPQLTKRAVAPIQKYMSKLCASLQQHFSDVSLVRDQQVVLVTLPCSELFAPNETVLKHSGEKYLRPFNSLLKYPTMYKVLVSVHTDNTGDARYRDEITSERALAITEFWAGDSGEKAESVIPYGIGDEEELVPNNSITNRAKNRRVDIYIVPNEGMVKTAAAGKLQ